MLGPEINVWDHEILRLSEAVLWTDTERFSDWLRTHKSVLLKGWSISHDISDRNRVQWRLLRLWRCAESIAKRLAHFFFSMAPTPVL